MELIPTKAYHISVDGSITEIAPENGTDFSLEEAQAHVGGYIEVVRLTGEQIMIVNEDGKFNKSYNPIASGIADLHNAIAKGDYISGEVVICPDYMLR